jgi:hypothetical protein
MKKQLDGNMLWRRLRDEKKKLAQDNIHGKIRGKKSKQITPDEKVEAILRAGLM